MELEAQGKYIDSTPIEHIFTQGEAYADKLVFVVDAVNNGVDVSGCTFVMRTVAIDGSMTETVLDKSIQGDKINLTWHVPNTATAIVGMLHLEIIGSQDAQLIIKYKMRAVFVKKAIFGENVPVPDAIEEKLAQMNELIEAAKKLFVIDATLTIEGQAADAKATGDAINVVQANVDACSDAINVVQANVDACTTNLEACSDAIEDLQKTQQEVVNARHSLVSDYTFATLSQRISADINSRTSQDAFERTMSEVYARLNALETSDGGVLAQSMIDGSVTEVCSEAEKVRSYAFYGQFNLTAVDFPNATSVEYNAFEICRNLTTVSLPAATSIGNWAFKECINLTTLSAPLATDISVHAFHSCVKLTTVDISSATSIGTYAFWQCAALTTVDISGTVNIATSAFAGCSALKTLVLRSTALCTLGNANALGGSRILGDGTGYIYVPAALVDDYKAATNWSTVADQFRALEDYTVDGTITGALDESKI